MENQRKGISFYGMIFKILPGGAMMVPLLFATLLNTLFPNLFGYFGGMPTAMFKNSAMCLAGLMLFAVGTSLDMKSIGKVAKRGIPLFVAKMAVSFGAGIAFTKLFGLDGIAGISAVAFVCAICACNPGIYSGLVEEYGDETDIAIYPLVNIAALPFWPLIVLAASSTSGFPVKDVISALLPLILGIMCGIIDPGLKKVMMPILPIAMVFMGFSFGSSLNLVTAVQSGISGILLALLYITINGSIMLLADRFLCRRPGYCGIAWTSVTGISMAAPAMLGEAYADYVAPAISQLMLTLVISSVVTGYLVKASVKKFGSPKYPLPGQTFEG